MKNDRSHRSFRGWLKRNFLTGVLVLIPIMGTIFLFTWGFAKITNKGLELLKNRDYFGKLYEEYGTSYDIIGRLIVIFALFGIISLVGFLTRNFLGRKVLNIAEKILENIPLINRIFIALKQLSKAFISSDRTLFSYVVLFEYPRKGIYSIGFVMSESQGEVQIKTKEEVLSVFLPTTPNPTSGFFLMVPRNDTIRLSMNVEEALKMIISGGAVVPDYDKNQFIKKYAEKAPETQLPENETQAAAE